MLRWPTLVVFTLSSSVLWWIELFKALGWYDRLADARDVSIEPSWRSSPREIPQYTSRLFVWSYRKVVRISRLENVKCAVLCRADTNSSIVVGSVETVPSITPVGSSSVKVGIAQSASCTDEIVCNFAFAGRLRGLSFNNWLIMRSLFDACQYCWVLLSASFWISFCLSKDFGIVFGVGGWYTEPSRLYLRWRPLQLILIKLTYIGISGCSLQNSPQYVPINFSKYVPL